MVAFIGPAYKSLASIQEHSCSREEGDKSMNAAEQSSVWFSLFIGVCGVTCRRGIESKPIASGSEIEAPRPRISPIQCKETLCSDAPEKNISTTQCTPNPSIPTIEGKGENDALGSFRELCVRPNTQCSVLVQRSGCIQAMPPLCFFIKEKCGKKARHL